MLARSLAVALQSSLGQSVVVENVPGAGGAIGVHRYLSGRHDGHSLLAATPIELIQTPMALKVKYEAEDLRLVGLVASSNLLLLVRPTLDVKSPQDLVALAVKCQQVLSRNREARHGRHQVDPVMRPMPVVEVIPQLQRGSTLA